METEILALISRKNYVPLQPKALAGKLGLERSQMGAFRKALRGLMQQGRAELGKGKTVRPAEPHGTAVGTYRRTHSGRGFVRPHAVDGQSGPEIAIREDRALDAAPGDEVLVRILRKSGHSDSARGEIVKVLDRATRQFVGTYFVREGEGFVRTDGAVFSHSIRVGDAGAKGAKPDDKVVFEMVTFPSIDDRGEGVITEVLGPRGVPGVDTLAVIREFHLPDKFPEAALAEARAEAARFDESDLDGRKDFTKDLVITIDPADARDFDDAVSLVRDEKSGHWRLSVHIADVGHFAPAGGPLDAEARARATSVYLPQRVIPMFPEVISNGLASLQEGRLRYVKSVVMDFSSEGQQTAVRFANGAIRVRKRFAYEQVSAIYAAAGDASEVEPEVRELLFRMRDLSALLRARRKKRGVLELEMPEAQLEFDADGRVSGAHFAVHDVSHQVIEDFMLAANEAVAAHFAALGVPFLRRVHPAPEPLKLESFAEFARILGYKIKRGNDRFALQRVLDQSAARPDRAAVHYALLRSLKQAVYSPVEDEHYALASTHYCHFTSPIRRYPDLTVHRLLGRWLKTKRAGSDEQETIALGEHCSKMERRAATAERELIKVKILAYLEERLGLQLEAVITGVADYGFFAQATKLPAEGLVHVSALTDDYYHFDEQSHTLEGQRTRRRFRLGDTVIVEVVRVDQQRRKLDFRLVDRVADAPEKRPGKNASPKRR